MALRSKIFYCAGQPQLSLSIFFCMLKELAANTARQWVRVLILTRRLTTVSGEQCSDRGIGSFFPDWRLNTGNMMGSHFYSPSLPIAQIQSHEIGILGFPVLILYTLHNNVNFDFHWKFSSDVVFVVHPKKPCSKISGFPSTCL